MSVAPAGGPSEVQAQADADRAAARRLNLIDTKREPVYDDMVSLMAAACDAPIALITLCDQDRLWFKAKTGISERELPMSDADFCRATMKHRGLVVVRDAAKDPAFAKTNLVTGPLGVRFYAGIPLISRNYDVIGTVCVLDRMPRDMTADQLSSLRAVAQQVQSVIEFRELASMLNAAEDPVTRLSKKLAEVVDDKLAPKQRLGEAIVRRAESAMADFKQNPADSRMFQVRGFTPPNGTKNHKTG